MSPYKMSGTTVVSFSGGRTSAYMLRQVLDANDDLDDLIVTFASTGKEHPVTHDFVNECSLRWQVPIIWQEYRDDDRGFTIVTYETASRDGEPFAALVRKRSYLPNPVTRFCTIDLKIRVIHKYQGSLHWFVSSPLLGAAVKVRLGSARQPLPPIKLPGFQEV